MVFNFRALRLAKLLLVFFLISLSNFFCTKSLNRTDTQNASGYRFSNRQEVIFELEKIIQEAEDLKIQQSLNKNIDEIKKKIRRLIERTNVITCFLEPKYGSCSYLNSPEDILHTSQQYYTPLKKLENLQKEFVPKIICNFGFFADLLDDILTEEKSYTFISSNIIVNLEKILNFFFNCNFEHYEKFINTLRLELEKEFIREFSKMPFIPFFIEKELKPKDPKKTVKQYKKEIVNSFNEISTSFGEKVIAMERLLFLSWIKHNYDYVLNLVEKLEEFNLLSPQESKKIIDCIGKI